MKRTVLALALGAATTMATAAIAGPEGRTGGYLTARTAERHSDFARAAAAWRDVLARHPGRLDFAERAISNAINAGDMDTAIALSHRLVESGQRSQIAALALAVEMVETGAWSDLAAALSGDLSVGPLVDGLARGWAHLGTGDRAAAEAAFDTVASARGLRTFGLMHKAYALAALGDDASAETIWATGNDGKPLRLSRRSAFARIAGLARLGRRGAAIAILDKLFDPAQDAEAAGLRAAILRGEPPAPAIPDARRGMAETFLAVATALRGEATDGYTLIYARAAARLAPRQSDALILEAELLTGLGLDEAALTAWRKVPEGGAWFTARLGAADALRALGRGEEAIGLLTQLAETPGATGRVHLALGDALRDAGRLGEAVTAYDAAVAAADADDVPWRTLFARGIALDRAGHWDAAKADLRAALTAAPEEPNVLNYLGYAMAERGERLGEALRLVEAAAAAQPESGQIADSVGWVLHLMGLHGQAVEHLERAVSLMPGDATVNEHLGDGYWAVGRAREARFQWRRALAFAPEGAEADRIRAKMLRGPAAAAESAALAVDGTPAELAATTGN